MTDSPARSLSAAERLDWLRLIRSENVGPVTFYRLLEAFGSASAALRAAPEMSRRGGRAKAIKVCPRAAAEREMETLERLGGRLVARIEPDYPPLLAHIEDAPPVLAVLGHCHLLGNEAVAVVGARNASINGRRLAARLAAELGAGGLVVVSGLARGIDASAHQGALETGTVAVQAGGIDVIYPEENAGLYRDIVGRGVVVSEMAPGTRPLARHFPRRNRLISGIARGVVVVEAGLRSGSLITARMALEQGREVFAVPGSPIDPRSQGTNRLIRDGAVLTESAEHVFEVLDPMLRKPLAEGETLDFKAPSPTSPGPDEVDSGRREIVDGLGPAPVMVDEIIRNCHLSAPVVSMVLLELELAGRLERHPGNRVSLILESRLPT